MSFSLVLALKEMPKGAADTSVKNHLFTERTAEGSQSHRNVQCTVRWLKVFVEHCTVELCICAQEGEENQQAIKT